MFVYFFFIIIIIIINFLFCNKKYIESFQNTKGKGNLYLLLEAPGFNVPELKLTKEIMSPCVATSNFNKVVVVANSASYKNPSTDSYVMNDQWNNSLVTNLNLPIEKWCFVCCSSPIIPAQTLITNLTSNFTDISGFLIDSEDGQASIANFVTVFNNLGNKYKYAIVGGTRKTLPQWKQYKFTFDYFFSEIYTEGTNEMDRQFYIKNSTTVQGAACVLTDCSGVSTFWNGVNKVLGPSVDPSGNPSPIIPTVCGSGNCQEKLYGNPCFDERLSNKNIDNLLNGNTSGRKDFAIWYGTGQTLSCNPSTSCIQLNSTTCSSNNKCNWSDYKKNPITGNKGLCYADTTVNWGCSTTWK